MGEGNDAMFCQHHQAGCQWSAAQRELGNGADQEPKPLGHAHCVPRGKRELICTNQYQLETAFDTLDRACSSERHLGPTHAYQSPDAPGFALGGRALYLQLDQPFQCKNSEK